MYGPWPMAYGTWHICWKGRVWALALALLLREAAVPLREAAVPLREAAVPEKRQRQVLAPLLPRSPFSRELIARPNVRVVYGRNMRILPIP